MKNNENTEGIIYGDQNLILPNHMNYGRVVLEKLLTGKEKVALINGATNDQIKYSELAQQVVNVASALMRMGVKKGDVVAICSENRTEFLITAIAVFCSNAVLTFINNAYSKNELTHTTTISKPTYMFLSPRSYKLYYDTFKSLNFIKKIYVFGPSCNSAVISFRELVENYTDVTNFETYDFQGQVQTALILYSSGTTGLPKGVKLTHRNMIVSSLQKSCFRQKNMTVLSLAPWCNSVGIVLTMLALLRNDSIVYLDKFQEDVYLDCIQKYKVNLLLAVPPLIVLLSKTNILKHYDVSSVSVTYSCGAPLDAETIIRFKKRYPGVQHILQGYGLTESTGAATQETENVNKLGSVGTVVEGGVMKIVDTETSRILGPNQIGEICFKGLILFEGYVGRNLKGDLDDDGFYRSGDMGYYDDDGFFFIVDRVKELIKYKTHQVSPSELEGMLRQHEEVKDAAVVGMPDPIAGELPTAFVVKNPGSKVSETELINYVATLVSPWKYLRGGVKFIDVIPKTGSGKILRRKLRDLLTKPPGSKL